MKLARPYRHGRRSRSPRLLAAELAANAQAARRSRAPTVAPPGFSTCACADAPSSGLIAASSPSPTAWGRVDRRSGRARSTSSSCRPTRPARSTIGNARGRVRRRPALPRPRGRRPAGDARVLLQRLGRRRSATSARRSLAIRRGRAGPRGRLPRRVRRGPRRGRAGRRLGRGRRPPAPTPRRRRALGRRRRSAPGSRPASTGSASTSTSGRPRARSTSEGWVERAVERLRGRRPRLRAGRRALVPLDRLRRRQGPGHHPLERPADVLRRRHRLRHREVQPRLRPPDLHLGRRSPRDGRPRSGTRPRRWATTATPSRCSSTRGSASSATASEVSMCKRAGEFITLDELLEEVGVDAARWFFASRAATTRHRLRHRARQEAVEREPGLLRPVRARPDRLDPAQGGRGRAGAGDRRRRPASAARPRRALARAIVAPARRSSRTRSPPRRPTASRPTRPSSRRRSTRFYRDARVVDAEAPERSAARLALAGPPRSPSPTRSGLLGISAPESM